MINTDLMDSFFRWCNKHDYFITGMVVGLNLIASNQSFREGDDTWGYVSLVIALGLWYIYVKNVNKEEPKYKD